MTAQTRPAPGVPATAAARGRIAPARLAHIVFRTAQKEALVAWYRTVFEAEESLADLPDSPARNALVDAISYVVERRW